MLVTNTSILNHGEILTNDPEIHIIHPNDEFIYFNGQFVKSKVKTIFSELDNTNTVYEILEGFESRTMFQLYANHVKARVNRLSMFL